MYTFELFPYSRTDGCRRDRVRMVVIFTTTCSISAYHHWWCEFESRSGRGVQHYVIKFVSDFRQVGGFLRFPPPRYNWNIVESGVKHHQTNKTRTVVHNLTVPYESSGLSLFPRLQVFISTVKIMASGPVWYFRWEKIPGSHKITIFGLWIYGNLRGDWQLMSNTN